MWGQVSTKLVIYIYDHFFTLKKRKHAHLKKSLTAFRKNCNPDIIIVDIIKALYFLVITFQVSSTKELIIHNVLWSSQLVEYILLQNSLTVSSSIGISWPLLYCHSCSIRGKIFRYRCFSQHKGYVFNYYVFYFRTHYIELT